jgi:photosystem II stability/assembly factor-like uncharacterized protein
VGGLPTGTVNGFAADPTNSKVMYVAMREGVFRSDDAGRRWTLTTGSPKSAAAVAVNPRQPTEVYVATMEGGIFTSRNGGQTWDAVRALTRDGRS